MRQRFIMFASNFERAMDSDNLEMLDVDSVRYAISKGWLDLEIFKTNQKTLTPIEYAVLWRHQKFLSELQQCFPDRYESLLNEFLFMIKNYLLVDVGMAYLPETSDLKAIKILISYLQSLHPGIRLYFCLHQIVKNATHAQFYENFLKCSLKDRTVRDGAVKVAIVWLMRSLEYPDQLNAACNKLEDLFGLSKRMLFFYKAVAAIRNGRPVELGYLLKQRVPRDEQRSSLSELGVASATPQVFWWDDESGSEKLPSLWYEASENAVSVEVCNILVNSGYPMITPDKGGVTLLHLVVMRGLNSYLGLGVSVDALKRELVNKVNPDLLSRRAVEKIKFALRHTDNPNAPAKIRYEDSCHWIERGDTPLVTMSRNQDYTLATLQCMREGGVQNPPKKIFGIDINKRYPRRIWLQNGPRNEAEKREQDKLDAFMWDWRDETEAQQRWEEAVVEQSEEPKQDDHDRASIRNLAAAAAEERRRQAVAAAAAAAAAAEKSRRQKATDLRRANVMRLFPEDQSAKSDQTGHEHQPGRPNQMSS